MLVFARSTLAFLLAFSIPAAADAASPNSEPGFQCRYQASAYITFLSVPIFSRSRVGFGSAGAAERIDGPTHTITLRFVGGSIPERAHGLNRFGFIQENVERKDLDIVSSRYFGLMTSNEEESLTEAKAALAAPKKGELPFVAVRAVVNREGSSYAVRRLLLPSSYGASSADQLLQQMQAEFAAPPNGKGEKSQLLSAGTAGTFLNTLRQAILTDAAAYKSRVLFNGKLFRFEAQKHPDLKTGMELRKLSLTASPEQVMQLSATLRNETTNEVTNFRLWFEHGAPNFLPLRFEFKAKPYLRLVFDREAAPPIQQLSENRESGR